MTYLKHGLLEKYHGTYYWKDLMQVYKNFIDQVRFDDLAAVISSQQFPWYYNYIVEKEDLNPKMSINQNFQFTHTFFNFHRIQSEYFLDPVFPTWKRSLTRTCFFWPCLSSVKAFSVKDQIVEAKKSPYFSRPCFSYVQAVPEKSRASIHGSIATFFWALSFPSESSPCQKMQNFRARREKLRKTNVNLTPLTP